MINNNVYALAKYYRHSFLFKKENVVSAVITNTWRVWIVGWLEAFFEV